MLDAALVFLKGELNGYLASRTGSSAVAVDLSRIVDETGKVAFPDDSLAISVLSIEEDRVLRSQAPEYTLVNGQHVQVQPDLRVNLLIVVAANFRHYDQSLKYLSHVLTFFQACPKFTPTTHPALDASIERLTLELQSPGFEQLNQIWASIGGKMLPAVYYRVRVISLQDRAPDKVQPPLTSVQVEARVR